MEKVFEIFGQWFAEAGKSGIKEPTAMTLSTATSSGAPSSRVVLLKNWDERGFVFYTNSTSRKGHDLEDNPRAALNFYWMDMQRQVRIEGDAESVQGKEADEYYNSRHLEKRIGAWASKQSQVLPSRDDLLRRIDEAREKYGDNPPRPAFWHGYRIKPRRIEFWQEGEFRLHQRDVYERDAKGRWTQLQLYP